MTDHLPAGAPLASSVKVACIQVNASNDLAENLSILEGLIRATAAEGATFITTPENACMMTWGRKNAWAQAHVFEGHPAVTALATLAAELEVWVLIGSISVRLEGDMLANRSVLLTPEGHVAATYDKLHMFDVTLAEGEAYRESNSFQAGSQAVVIDTPWAPLGLSVCYDVRFAVLYRALAHAGAHILTVPAAFTKTTGQAHWHTLLQSRAIETGSFVLAPAQTGTHEGGRQTFGHSLIINPWGEILADAGQDVGYVVADLDLDQVRRVRSAIPSLTHDRAFTVERVSIET